MYASTSANAFGTCNGSKRPGPPVQVYPEVFERLHLTPPRGVLFYGPPGALSDAQLVYTRQHTLIRFA